MRGELIERLLLSGDGRAHAVREPEAVRRDTPGGPALTALLLQRGAGPLSDRFPLPLADSAQDVDDQAAGRKVLLVRLDRDTMRRLKHLAVDRDSTLQALAAEAIDLLFERYGG